MRTVQQLTKVKSRGLISDVDGRLSAVESETAGLGSLAYVTPTGTPNGTKFLRDDNAWTAPTATVAISSASVAFTDGDTVRRVTVADAAVTSTSKFVCSVVRPTVAEADDPGWVYSATVVSRGAGTFDVVVKAMAFDGSEPDADSINETVTLNYLVSA